MNDGISWKRIASLPSDISVSICSEVLKAGEWDDALELIKLGTPIDSNYNKKTIASLLWETAPSEIIDEAIKIEPKILSHKIGKGHSILNILSLRNDLVLLNSTILRMKDKNISIPIKAQELPDAYKTHVHMTPPEAAIYDNREKTIDTLIKHGLFTSEKKESFESNATAYFISVLCKSNKSIIKKIGNNFNKESIFMGQNVPFLFHEQPDVAFEGRRASPFSAAIHSGHKPFIDLFLDDITPKRALTITGFSSADKLSQTAFGEAVMCDDLNTLQQMISKCGGINDLSSTWATIMNGFTAIERGANALDFFEKKKNDEENTSTTHKYINLGIERFSEPYSEKRLLLEMLDLSVKHKSVNTFKFLVNQGVNFNLAGITTKEERTEQYESDLQSLALHASVNIDSLKNNRTI